MASRRILLADDEFSGRELLARMLKQFTCGDVVKVRDGAVAVSQFQILRPQLTLLDIDMPALDGMSAFEQIRALDPQAFVVLVSAHSRLELVQRAVELAVGGFIVKPYSAQRVLAVLRHYVVKTGDSGMLMHRAASTHGVPVS